MPSLLDVISPNSGLLGEDILQTGLTDEQKDLLRRRAYWQSGMATLGNVVDRLASPMRPPPMLDPAVSSGPARYQQMLMAAAEQQQAAQKLAAQRQAQMALQGLAAETDPARRAAMFQQAAPMLAMSGAPIGDLSKLFGPGEATKLGEGEILVGPGGKEIARGVMPESPSLLTPDEVRAAGLAPGTVAQKTSKGIEVIQKPESTQINMSAKYNDLTAILGRPPTLDEYKQFVGNEGRLGVNQATIQDPTDPTGRRFITVDSNTYQGGGVGSPGVVGVSKIEPTEEEKASALRTTYDARTQAKLAAERPREEAKVNFMKARAAETKAAIDRLINNKEGLKGITGGIEGRLPSISEASTKAQADFDFIKSRGLFDYILTAKNLSPTGGFVGNVSNFEVQKLESSIGSLAQTQSAKDFEDALKRLKADMEAADSALSDAFEKTYSFMTPTASAPPPKGTRITSSGVRYTVVGD